MKQNSATSQIVADKRRVKTNGTSALKLCITYKGIRKYYATGFDANDADWILIQSNKAKGDLRKIALDLSEIKFNAQKCCDNLDSFTFLKFETVFFPKSKPIVDLQSAYDEYIKELNQNEQIGTAQACGCSCVSLHKFNPKLKLEDITVNFLERYEKWFLSDGKSITTVGIYLRALRSVINKAIRDGIMDAKDYPFGKQKFVIPTGKNIKKALSLEDIGKIYNYPAEAGSVDDMCRDYWMFIYLCNGLNVKDLCLLTYKNITNDFIEFQRAKTIRTRRSNPEPIRVALKAESRHILKKWGQPKLTLDTYIFPHLEPNMSLKVKQDKVQLLVHIINEHMKKIAQSLGIDKQVTTYYARHSFATVLKNSGVSTEFICEALGHSSLATTKNYLAGFEKDAINQTTDVLLSFKSIM